MIKEQLSNISMNGRMAYSIMCIENYLLSKYSDRDWSLLAKKMWAATNMPWDEWDERFMEVIPKYLFEFNNYQEAGFEFISEDEYHQFVSLYNGITDGSTEDISDPVNYMLLCLHQIQDIYAYTNIPGNGDECLNIVEKMTAILAKEHIDLPPIDQIRFSSFDQRHGWGDYFEGEYLSIILR
ncbi:hypothetical protein [Butyrivibrio proteoclasticus]|uniref:hypothetical protein n=1 Tax=Butyrivibrio proteoclasticus TaxID=43305 RepID=UPI00047B8F13|nr:hypothetical protein [Butyrivibrio proteoclasticus]